MGTVRLWVVALLACGAVTWPTLEAAAQPLGLDPNGDCQTLLTCRFTRGGVYRGCLSSYSCRVCSFIAPCRTNSGSRVCRQLVCTWS